MVSDRKTVGTFSAKCGHHSVTSVEIINPALRKSTLTVFGALCVSVLSTASMFSELQDSQRTHPTVESVHFVSGNGTDLCGSAQSVVLRWNGNTLDCEEVSSVSSVTSVLSNWILQQDTEELSNEPIHLKYIDFFAGTRLLNHRYSAFRLLEAGGWMIPHSEMLTREIEYLYPDIPLTIQGREGTISLTTEAAVKEWKIEVLQQEFYESRLRQYALYRISEERSTMVYDLSSVPGLQVQFKYPTDWSGWVIVRASIQIDGCSPLKVDEGFFVSSPDSLNTMVYLPAWQWGNDSKCHSLLETQGVKAVSDLQIRTSEKQYWDVYQTHRYSKTSTDCNSSSEILSKECFNKK